MTNSIKYQNQPLPAYSGITINITNPTLNAAPLSTTTQVQGYKADNEQNINPTPNFSVQEIQSTNNRVNNSVQQGVTNPIQPAATTYTASGSNLTTSSLQQNESLHSIKNNEPNANSTAQPQSAINNTPQAYPPQYYLNNYNYIQGGQSGNAKNSAPNNANKTEDLRQTLPVNSSLNNDHSDSVQEKEEDMTSSTEIINELDSRVAEQKELEKNGKKTRVIALTNEYIMSLENYLNNPNTEIRLMAAKEILTRLDEDKNRYDDAALNALLNKMLQDPEKLVRIAALSAFSSQLASGNDYTVDLLTKIQKDPNADKEDVLEAADILLKMSASTEIKYTPVHNTTAPQPQAEQQ